MRISALVIAAEDNDWKNKKDGTLNEDAVITFLDRSEHSPMKNTFDMTVRNARAKDFGPLINTVVQVDIKDFRVFGGRLDATASIVDSKGNGPLPTKPGPKA